MTNLAGRPPRGLKEDKLTPAQEREDKAFMRKVKQLPCVICGKGPPSDAHHVIHGRYGNRRPRDCFTIPLCKSHHQDGPEAIHNGKETWAKKHGFDYDFLPTVRDMVNRMEEDDILGDWF